jgi:hypothetical protein
MWTSVVAAVMALAAPAADSGPLTLSNIRATHGILGPSRGDNKVLPGDRFVLCFDIEGITIGADGKVAYSIGTEVRNSAGRVQLQQEPKAVEAPTSLGGNRVPAHARLDVGLDTPPGVFTLKVTVSDRVAGTSTSLTREVEVLPKSFGIVRLSITNDPEGQLPAAAFGAGQAAWLQMGVVGFDPVKNGPPSVTFKMRILDRDGRPTQANPLSSPSSKDLPAGAALAPVQFLLSLNRPGRFVIEVSASDTSSGKSATLTVPLVVAEPL